MKYSFNFLNGTIKYLLPSAILLLNVNHANAMDYTFGYYLPVSTEYNSNIQMVEKNKNSIQLYKFTPRFTAIARDELNSINFGGSLGVERSSDRNLSEDREDPNLNLGWQRDFSKGSLNLSTAYNKSSTRTSEFTKSGLVFSDGSAISRSYNLGINYLLSDKLTVASGVGYQTQQYSGTSLGDYSSKNFNVKLNYQYSEKFLPFISYSISSYKQDGSTSNTFTGNTGDSISQNYNAGFNYQVSPKFNYNIALGANHVNSQGSSWIGSAGLNWLLYDRSSLSVNVQRETSVSGLGGFQKSDGLSAKYTYDISSVDSIAASFSWSKNKSINDAESKELNASYSRVISENWSMSAYTQYRNLDSSNQTANGYTLGASISYNQPNF